jgi:hypothetical protein
MKKLAVLLFVGVLVWAAVMLGKRQSGEQRPSMWDKMRQHMEDMPEDFPPRVMFDNVADTKENTERILEILEKGDHIAGQETADPNAG